MRKTMMTILVTGMLATGLACAGETGDRHVTKIAIAETGANGHDPVYVQLSGDEMGFELKDMQVGESRSVVDSSGQDVLITRTEDGYDFAVDGRNVSMPALDGQMAHVELIDFSDGDHDIDVVAGSAFVSAGNAKGITIISSEPLDAATQTSIRSVLQSAGRTDDVNFIDRSSAQHAHGVSQVSEHKIKVVKKEINATR